MAALDKDFFNETDTTEQDWDPISATDTKREINTQRKKVKHKEAEIWDIVNFESSDVKIINTWYINYHKGIPIQEIQIDQDDWIKFLDLESKEIVNIYVTVPKWYKDDLINFVTNYFEYWDDHPMIENINTILNHDKIKIVWRSFAHNWYQQVFLDGLDTIKFEKGAKLPFIVNQRTWELFDSRMSFVDNEYLSGVESGKLMGGIFYDCAYQMHANTTTGNILFIQQKNEDPILIASTNQRLILDDVAVNWKEYINITNYVYDGQEEYISYTVLLPKDEVLTWDNKWYQMIGDYWNQRLLVDENSKYYLLFKNWNLKPIDWLTLKKLFWWNDIKWVNKNHSENEDLINILNKFSGII